MISIERFVFNLFQVNTYVLYDETGECVIIDPGCYEDFERERLKAFIDSNDLKPVRLINTHAHIDHVLGNSFISKTYDLKADLHRDGLPFLERMPGTAAGFGLTFDSIPPTGKFLEEGELIEFGNSKLQVLHTPGHANGSICLYNEEQKFVIVGDVLFYGSIGRTDLPTGDFDLLNRNIRDKLFTLSDNVTVYSGHGPETNIGYEKRNNPFVGGGN